MTKDKNVIEMHATNLVEIGLDYDSLLAVLKRAVEIMRDRDRAAFIASLPKEDLEYLRQHGYEPPVTPFMF
jgi:hypothetical protein